MVSVTGSPRFARTPHHLDWARPRLRVGPPHPLRIVAPRETVHLAIQKFEAALEAFTAPRISHDLKFALDPVHLARDLGASVRQKPLHAVSMSHRLARFLRLERADGYL